MLKNIILDMGNVLIKYDPYFISKNIFSNRKDTEYIADIIAGSQQWKFLDEGKISDEEAIFALCKKYPEYKNKINIYMNAWIEFLPEIKGMYDVVYALKNKGYKLHLLSNASVRFYEYYKRYPVFSLLDSINISADMKIAKPDRQIYEKLLKKYNIIANEALFIDDSKENIASAKELNINVYLFKNCQNFKEFLYANKII